MTARFVRRLVEERPVPFVELGRLIRFESVEVEAWNGPAGSRRTGRRHFIDAGHVPPRTDRRLGAAD